MSCLAGKQTRLPFPQQSSYRSGNPLELVSVDLCGPITPETQSGNRYFMLLIDDCTRFIWVYMLKSNDQALECFKNFKAKVEKEVGRSIKTLRSNRGGKFTSIDFANFCEKNAYISMQLTTLYIPQHNGIVERRNRTVMNMTRSLLKQMSIPHVFWAEGVRHSVYILNRVTTKAHEK